MTSKAYDDATRKSNVNGSRLFAADAANPLNERQRCHALVAADEAAKLNQSRDANAQLYQKLYSLHLRY